MTNISNPSEQCYWEGRKTPAKPTTTVSHPSGTIPAPRAGWTKGTYYTRMSSPA